MIRYLIMYQLYLFQQEFQFQVIQNFCYNCWGNTMSRHQYHWCMLSPLEWETCSYKKGDSWTVQLSQYNLKKQLLNVNIVPNDKKGFLPMLFDSIPIENYIFSLLHAEIYIGNKIIHLFYKQITTYVEPLSEEEVDMSDMLIDLQIHNKQTFEHWTEQNFTTIVELRIEKKLIDTLLKEKDD